MKKIALMMTYNNLNFFKYSLKQALSFCDEVIVIEGAHLNVGSPRSNDGTCEYLNNVSNPKLTVVQDFKPAKKYKPLQFKLRRKYAKKAKHWRPGNWIIQWDDDMLFFDKDLEKLDEIMRTTNKDTVVSRERRFAYNFKFSLLSSEIKGAKWHRITKGCFYKPISKLCYRDGTPYIERGKRVLKMGSIIYHHYTFVKLSSRAKLRWQLSVNKGETSNKKTYELWKKIKWDSNRKDVLKQLTKQRADFLKVIGGQGNIEIYNGEHPEILKDHPWKSVDDIRRVIK